MEEKIEEMSKWVGERNQFYVFGIVDTMAWLALLTYFIFEATDGTWGKFEKLAIPTLIFYMPGVALFIWNAIDDNLTSRYVY